MDVQEEQIYSFVGENLALDFTNTGGALRSDSPRDYFGSYADLVSWGKQAGVLSPEDGRKLLQEAERHPEEATRLLSHAQDFKNTLRRIFASIAEERPVSTSDLQAFNREVSAAMCRARVLPDENGAYSWAWDDLSGSLDSVLWPVARAAADLLTEGNLSRVRQCASDTCGWLFLDTTRNHSRQWCDMRDCGNRAKARRHYHRKKGAVS